MTTITPVTFLAQEIQSETLRTRRSASLPNDRARPQPVHPFSGRRRLTRQNRRNSVKSALLVLSLREGKLITAQSILTPRLICLRRRVGCQSRAVRNTGSDLFTGNSSHILSLPSLITSLGSQFPLLDTAVHHYHGTNCAVTGIIWILFVTGTTLSVPGSDGCHYVHGSSHSKQRVSGHFAKSL
jgi:hypothetical protein